MYVYLLAAIIVAAISGAGVWKVQQWRHDSEKLAIAEKVREDRVLKEKIVDKAAVGHEKDKVQIRTVFRTVEKEVTRVVKEPFYVDGACLNDDGLRIVAESLGPAAPASGVAAGAVPGVKPPHWWQPRRSADVDR